MPFVRIWVHLIWSTKNREKIIFKEFRQELLEHIKINSKKNEIWLDSVNCTNDHFHLLLSLNAEMPISKAVMLIKGESSHWINQNKYCNAKFQWQDEYIALSVSESIIERVRVYINNQELHHKKRSFSDEYSELLKRYGDFSCEN
jgi:REP element-mobilizing transposase RayT